MRSYYAFLKFVGRAILTSVGGPCANLAGDFLFDFLPEVAQDVWSTWGKGRNEEQRRTELEQLAKADQSELRTEIEQVVREVAAEQTEETRQTLGVYLSHLQVTIRQQLRRPADPTGTTVPSHLSPCKAEDLAAFLPNGLPRFKAGLRPLENVDWELVELLGVGGFGEVWKARNPYCIGMAPVALKFCLDATAAKLLRHEAAVLDRVMRHGKHPGIVGLQQTYLDAATPCLQYELVEGGDLAGLVQEWHRKCGGPTPRQAAKVILRIADIVASAHQLDPPIVHRDLKPTNVLVYKDDNGSNCFRITDFGIGGPAARRAILETATNKAANRSLATALPGSCTPLYASPQQLGGSDPDPRDDVFSLGVIWYQLVTGDLNAGAPRGTQWEHRLADRRIRSSMIELMAACFEEKPADRPTDATDLAGRLRVLLEDKSTESQAPPPAPPSESPQVDAVSPILKDIADRHSPSDERVRTIVTEWSQSNRRYLWPILDHVNSVQTRTDVVLRISVSLLSEERSTGHEWRPQPPIDIDVVPWDDGDVWSVPIESPEDFESTTRTWRSALPDKVKRCEECSGEAIVPCSACGATGRVQNDCPACGGEGRTYQAPAVGTTRFMGGAVETIGYQLCQTAINGVTRHERRSAIAILRKLRCDSALTIVAGVDKHSDERNLALEAIAQCNAGKPTDEGSQRPAYQRLVLDKEGHEIEEPSARLCMTALHGESPGIAQQAIKTLAHLECFNALGLVARKAGASRQRELALSLLNRLAELRTDVCSHCRGRRTVPGECPECRGSKTESCANCKGTGHLARFPLVHAAFTQADSVFLDESSRRDKIVELASRPLFESTGQGAELPPLPSDLPDPWRQETRRVVSELVKKTPGQVCRTRLEAACIPFSRCDLSYNRKRFALIVSGIDDKLVTVGSIPRNQQRTAGLKVGIPLAVISAMGALAAYAGGLETGIVAAFSTELVVSVFLTLLADIKRPPHPRWLMPGMSALWVLVVFTALAINLPTRSEPNSHADTPPYARKPTISPPDTPALPPEAPTSLPSTLHPASGSPIPGLILPVTHISLSPDPPPQPPEPPTPVPIPDPPLQPPEPRPKCLYFPRFPYDHVPGYLMDNPCEVRDGDPIFAAALRSDRWPTKPRTWAARLRVEYASDLDDLDRIGGHLLLSTRSRLGLDTEASYLQEHLPGDRHDHLWLGDCNVVYRFAQSEHAQFRSGVGVNWMDDPLYTNFGFNFTCGADFFPSRPWIVSTNIDWGTLESAELFRFRGTVGAILWRMEVYTGYEYLDVDSTRINTILGGVRIWF